MITVELTFNSRQHVNLVHSSDLLFVFNHVSVVTAEELSDCKVGNFGVVLGRVLPVCGLKTSC